MAVAVPQGRPAAGAVVAVHRVLVALEVLVVPVLLEAVVAVVVVAVVAVQVPLEQQQVLLVPQEL